MPTILITGDREFVRSAVRTIESEMKFRQEFLNNRPTLETLLSNECAQEGITVGESLTRGRLDTRTKVRTIFCVKGAKNYSYTLREIAHFLGLNPGTVSRMIKSKTV